MKTQKLKKRSLSYKLSRLSKLGPITFIAVFIFVTFFMIILTKVSDFPASASVIDIEQSWTRGEYKKIYNHFLNEIEKLKYWQAYQYAVKLQKLDEDEFEANEENQRYIEFIAQTVPRQFKEYAESQITFDALVNYIKKQYLTFIPNTEQGTTYLKYNEVDNKLIKNIPNYVLTSGFEAEVAADKIDFADYSEFIKLRIQKDLESTDSKELSSFIDNNFYSFRQFMSRSILRNFGRKLLGLPENYTFIEKKQGLTFKEKVNNIQTLFAYIRDNVAVVTPDKNYIPAYPLDTLYRGYGDLESVNYLFSDLVSSVLGVNSIQLSFPKSDAKPLLCLIYNETLKLHKLYGFDFHNSIPLINDEDELLDVIGFCTGSETESSITSKYCPYIKQIQSGGNFQPKYFANMFQLNQKLALYLNNEIDLDIRPLPLSGSSYRSDVLFKNSMNSRNFEYIIDIFSVWGEFTPSELGQRLFLLTEKSELNLYFSALTSSKAASLNLSTRKTALIFGWLEDAATSFANAESDYLTSDHSDRYIRDYNMLMFSNIDRTSGLIPFAGSGVLFCQTLIENYRQYKLTALEALYQSGLMYFNQGNFRKANVCFSDFVTKCEAESELSLKPNTFPGVYVNFAKYLMAKCHASIGNIDDSKELLQEMIDNKIKVPACKVALRFGFNPISKINLQTQIGN